MNAPLDVGLLVLCPELGAIALLERSLLGAAESIADAALGGGPELVCARLTLLEMLEELRCALDCYRELRLSLEGPVPF